MALSTPVKLNRKPLTLDDVYPVHSIYMSTNGTDTGLLFGGSWTRIQGRFLLGATGDTAETGTDIQKTASVGPGGMGGEAAHQLSVNEMPSHTHVQNSHNHPVGYRNISDQSGSTNRRHGPYGQSTDNTGNINAGGTTATNQNTGGSETHNNMPPFLSVFIWERTA